MNKNEKLKDVMRQINGLLVSSGLLEDRVVKGLQTATNVKLNLYEDALTVRWATGHMVQSFKIKADAVPKTHIFTEYDINTMQLHWETHEMPKLLMALARTLVTQCWHLIDKANAKATGLPVTQAVQHYQQFIDQYLATWKQAQSDLGNLELCVPEITITVLLQRDRLVFVLSEALQEMIAGKSRRRYYTANAPRNLYRKNEAA